MSCNYVFADFLVSLICHNKKKVMNWCLGIVQLIEHLPCRREMLSLIPRGSAVWDPRCHYQEGTLVHCSPMCDSTQAQVAIPGHSNTRERKESKGLELKKFKTTPTTKFLAPL